MRRVRMSRVLPNIRWSRHQGSGSVDGAVGSGVARRRAAQRSGEDDMIVGRCLARGQSGCL